MTILFREFRVRIGTTPKPTKSEALALADCQTDMPSLTLTELRNYLRGLLLPTIEVYEPIDQWVTM